MILSLIVAAAENGVIGKDNKLPWHLPDDLKYFKEITRGHPVIMGRKTFESIGRPLPDRENIVISKTMETGDHGQYRVFPELSGAFGYLQEQYGPSDEVFIIGGSALFEAALRDFPLKRIYLTRIHADVEGDVMLPKIDWSQWKESRAPHHHPQDEKHPFAFTFLTYERV